MGRSFSNAKTVSAFITTRISEVVSKRGYAAVAASSSESSSTIRTGAPKRMESTQTSWVPDPVTGYYRPENQIKQTDAAELRAMLVNNNITHN